MPGPQGNCLIVCPLLNANIEECKNTSTAKLPAPTLANAKASPKVRIKKRKNCPSLVPRYATITKHLNVVKIILHGTFDEKTEVHV